MSADTSELGDAGEKQWARLRAQIELAGTFWLGFVFSPSPRSVIVLRERAERLLRMQTRTLLLVRPKTPDELRHALPHLLEDMEPVRAGCTWIEAVREDSPGAPEQPWTRAWDELFLRMNERRDALRARLPGGLVFAAPPGIKPRVRDAAPDLWSVRSLVIDLAAVAGGGAERHGPNPVRTRPTARLTAPDPELALAEAERRTAKGSEVSQALALTEAAGGLLANRRVEEARNAAAKATDLLRGEGGIAEAHALALLAEAVEAGGDVAAAADHVEQAIRLARHWGRNLVPLEWLGMAGRLAHSRRDLLTAKELYGEAESIAREQAIREREAPWTLRNLSIALDHVGDMRRESGDLAGAATAYDESLTLRRRLRDMSGDRQEELRDLSFSLDRVGDIRRKSGDIAAAAAIYEESLELSRQLRTLRGDTSEALHDLSVALERVGDIRRESGDVRAAAAAYDEMFSLRLRLFELDRDNPEVLRALSVALDRTGDLLEEGSDRAAAETAYEESLALRRRLRKELGDTPEALQDLTISLTRVGDIRRESGALAGAAAAYEESLSLSRRLEELQHDAPEALRDLATSLERVANLRRESGDLAGAAAADNELRELTRPTSHPRKHSKPRKGQREA